MCRRSKSSSSLASIHIGTVSYRRIRQCFPLTACVARAVLPSPPGAWPHGSTPHSTAKVSFSMASLDPETLLPTCGSSPPSFDMSRVLINIFLSSFPLLGSIKPVPPHTVCSIHRRLRYPCAPCPLPPPTPALTLPTAATESTNDRVKWFSVMEAVTLVAMNVWQIYYLRRFFEVKRLV